MRDELDQAKRICLAAAELPGPLRDDFLKIACGSNSALRREVDQRLCNGGGSKSEVSKAQKRLSASTSFGFPPSDIPTLDPYIESLLWRALEQGKADRESLVGSLVKRHADHRAAIQAFLHWWDKQSHEASFQPQLPGRYRLEGVLGKGGLGLVYRAQDTKLGRAIAIKVLRPDRADQAILRSRFMDEAQISSQLQHPGIVPIYDVHEDRTPWFAMKIVRGRTLAQMLGEWQGPDRNLTHLLRLFERICQAVGYAHDHAVIHRDLKPENVMIGKFGDVQVLDWGLAKLVKKHRPHETSPYDGAPTDRSTVVHTRNREDDKLSQVGDIMGTPRYMPPEQARGEVDGLDATCDVFGLGAVLCEILTGKPPYAPDESNEDILIRAARGDLEDAYRRLEACGADRKLIDLSRECLAAAARVRPAHGSAVAMRIRAYLDHTSQRAEAARIEAARQKERANHAHHQRRQTIVFASVLTLFLVVGGFAFYLYIQDREARRSQIEHSVSMTLERVSSWNQRALELIADDRHDQALSVTQQAIQSLARQKGETSSVSLSQPLARQLDESIEETNRFVQELEARRSLHLRESALLLGLEQAEVPEVEEGFSWNDELVRLPTAIENTFNAFGVDPLRSPEAKTLFGTRIKETVLGSLDTWALALIYGQGKDEPSRSLLQLANLHDSNSWRTDLRTKLVNDLPVDLGQLVKQAKATRQPASSYQFLGRFLLLGGASGLAAEMFSFACERHPDNFSLHFFSGLCHEGLKNFDKAEQSYLMARSIRPDHLEAWHRLGLVQTRKGNDAEALATFTEILRQDPTYHHSFEHIARCQDKLGRSDDALKTYREAVQLSPNRASSWARLGSYLLDKNAHLEAARAYERAIQCNPSSGAAYRGCALAQRQAGQLEQALDSYYHAVESNPTDSSAWFGLGHVLTQLRRDKEAIAAYRVSLHHDSEFYMAWEHLSHLYTRLGDIHSALACSRKCTELKPRSFQSHLMLANSLSQTGQKDKAIDAVEFALRLDPSAVSAWVDLGIHLREASRIREAVVAFHTALRLDPRSLSAWRGLGILQKGQGYLDLALTSLLNAVAIDPRRAEVWTNVGNVLEQIGDQRGAIQVYRHATVLNPGYLPTWGVLGWALDRIGDSQGAMETWEKALRHDGNNIGVLIGLGTLHRDAGQLQSALQRFRKAVTLDPNHADAWLNLGLTHWIAGDLPLALRNLQRSVAIDPSNGPAWNSIGHICKANGEREAAIGAFEASLRVDPESADGWKGLADVRFEAEDYASAVDAYERAVALESIDHECWRRLGLSISLAGKSTEGKRKAAQALRKATQLGSKKALVELGELLVDLADFSEAIGVYTRAVEIDPCSPVAWRGLGVAQYHVGNLRSAVDSLQIALGHDPSKVAGWFYLGSAREHTGDLSGSVQAYLWVTKLAPRSHQAWERLGGALAQAERLKEAAHALERATAVDSRKVSSWLMRVRVLEQRKSHQEAFDVLRKAAEFLPKSEPILRQLGKAYQKNGNLQKSAEVFRRLASLVPGDPNIWNALGLAYWKAGNSPRARKAFERAIHIRPHDAMLWNNLGLAKQAGNDFEGAAEAYSRAIELDGSYPNPYVNRGNVHLTLKDRDAALRDYRLAIEANPRFPEAWLSISYLLKAKGSYGKALQAMMRGHELGLRHGTSGGAAWTYSTDSDIEAMKELAEREELFLEIAQDVTVAESLGDVRAAALHQYRRGQHAVSARLYKHCLPLGFFTEYKRGNWHHYTAALAAMRHLASLPLPETEERAEFTLVAVSWITAEFTSSLLSWLGSAFAGQPRW